MTTTEEPASLTPGSDAYRDDPTHYGIEAGAPWPEDVPRGQDDTRWRYQDDPKGARRAEMRIAACWSLTLVAGVALAVCFVTGGQAQLEGTFLFVAFGGLGVGFVLWARDLLPGHEVTASRGHHDHSPDGARSAVVASLGRGLEPMARRPFLSRMLALVGGVFGLAALFPIASLGPRPGKSLYHTAWGHGTRAVNSDGLPVKPGDIYPDGILTVFPESDPSQAQSSTLLINLGATPFEIPKGRETWHLGSVVAFSKICTHAGCPVSLYNTIFHQLVCPCHQSTFDVLQDCKPVFGPAPTPLPQLPLALDAEGYIISQMDYTVPVGPGFWNR